MTFDPDMDLEPPPPDLHDLPQDEQDQRTQDRWLALNGTNRQMVRDPR